MARAHRILAALAGLMGAGGVMLAAASAHLADAARLAAASSMLLFHACAVLGAVALAERGLLQARIGLAAAFGFVVGGHPFRGRSDASAICRARPVSDGRADRRHAVDRELAGARAFGCVAAQNVTVRQGNRRFARGAAIG